MCQSILQSLKYVETELVELLESFVSGKVFWEGDHVRLIVSVKDSKRLSDTLVHTVSASLRKICWRCVLDEVASARF